MAKKTWEFTIDGKEHKVELDHQYISSRRRIRVDGQELELDKKSSKPLLDYGSDHKFKIGNHECAVVIRTNGITYSYDLAIDGVSQKTGKQLASRNQFKGKNAIWWGPIESSEQVEKILKNIFWFVLIVSVLSAIIMSLLGFYDGWIDAILSSLVGLWLWKGRSLIASIILIILTGLSLVITFLSALRITEGGTNWILAVAALWLSIRGLQAVLWLRKTKRT
jgi:hypothetical protein